MDQSENSHDKKTNSEKSKVPKNEHKNWSDNIKLGLQIFGLAALIAYTTFAALQWCAMKEAVNVTATQFKLDQRAWLGFVGIMGEAEVGKPLLITVKFKNTGRTPAKNIISAAIAEPIPKTGVPNFTKEESITRESTAIVPPQGEFTIILSVTPKGPLDNDGFRSITSGETCVYDHGIINYNDIFNKKHWLTYCYVLSPDGKTYTIYKEHNDMDND